MILATADENTEVGVTILLLSGAVSCFGIDRAGEPRHQCGNLTTKYVGSSLTSILANNYDPVSF